MVDAMIRVFRPADRSELFRIAADTAFFGEPIEAYFDDRRLFLDAFYRYYTDFEPEHCWVAESSGALVGFLTGSTDTRMHDYILEKQVIPAVLRGLVRGRYRVRIKTLKYAFRLALAGMRKEFTQVDERIYPAHLHINVDGRVRSAGLGRRLMAAYLDQLRALKITGVHLMTTSQNVVACRLYEKVGFQLVDARSTGLWRGILPNPVENRAYALKLS